MTVDELVAPWVTRARFEVYGLPVPQGSKNAIRQGERTLIVERGRAQLRPWRNMIAAEAAEALPAPLSGAVEVELSFRLPRPKSHYRTGRFANELRTTAPWYVPTRPDVDKLARAVLDALAGVAFVDDAQVVSLLASKVYAERAGVLVELRELEG